MPKAVRDKSAEDKKLAEQRKQESTTDTIFRTVREQAGNASSLLSMAGATAMLSPGKVPGTKALVWASIAAGAVDTAIQGYRWLKGEKDSNFGTTLYAATGLLPAASLMWLRGVNVKPLVQIGVHMNPSDTYHLAALAANGGLIGYELIHRTPRIAQGEETPGGYMALGAALTGVMLPLRRW